MRFVLSIFIIVLPFLLFSQVNKYGVPEITNYSVTEYNASEQNWSIIQDLRGVMYFGNTDAVIEFDGKNWNRFPLNNNSIVRSLQVDEEGTIYVGGVGEFGYLQPGELGTLRYVELSDQIDSVNRAFNDVWKIYDTKDGIYFCSASKIFLYKNLELIKIINPEQHSFQSFYINQKLYVGNYMKGLLMIEDDTTVMTPGGEAFERKNIFSILPSMNDKLLIGTGQNGIFNYDPVLGYVKSNVIPRFVNDFFKNNVLYGGIQLASGNYAFPTISGGCVILDERGKPYLQLNDNNGLASLTVTSVYQNTYSYESEEPVWMASTNGISRVNLNSPFKIFDEKSGLKGSVYSIIRFNNILYVATNIGVFYLTFDSNNLPRFDQIPELRSAWDFHEFKTNGTNMLLVGTEYGLYEIYNTNSIRSIETNITNLEPKDKKYIGLKLMSSSKHPGELYVGGLDFYVLKYNENKNNWKQIHYFKEIKNVRSMHTDSDGKLWVATLASGIYNLDFNNEEDQIHYYDTTNGLPFIHSNIIEKYNDELKLATKGGLYKFDEKTNQFIPDTFFGSEYADGSRAITKFNQDRDGGIWLGIAENNLNKIERLILNEDGSYQKEAQPFNYLPKIFVENVYFDSDEIIWMGISNKLYSYDLSYQKDYEKKYNTLIRKVIIGQDSSIFNGTNYKVNENGEHIIALDQPSELKYILDYKYNGLTFQYVAPYFEKEEDIVYSSYLQGFKDPWSLWTNRTERVYTNLDRGQYTFMVKAKNVYGVESNVAEFHFTILPPWYKTVLAFIGYFILAIVIIIVIVKVYTRRLELEKIRLEGIVVERTAEVVKQKEEIEEQRDEIEEQKTHIMDSIFYARRIQQAVSPSPEKSEEILPEHFLLWLPHSIVSGDFWWMTEKDNKIIVVAADSTGHGVPGAFMSMLGVSFLNEIVNKQKVTSASVILNELRSSVKATLKQTGKEGEAKDGYDLALVIIDLEERKLQYAGAYNPLFVFRGEELIEIKADRNPIGIYIKEKESFTNNVFEFESRDTFYIFSDGYIDQFGGEKGQKFKTKNFKQLLADIQKEPMKKQREILDQTMLDWRGDQDQIDDIIILGVRLP